ncbi:hypothetical protein NPIL_525031 [Nephila pilipes]|uniref:Uncharacterized protein n=1 Tax=Nephila pilipes TaxID=299642 RepID=A0A8X6NNY6_NEPPI|nr:hypothetical protein NPIL_525031 [Nephila pilipes]
MIIKNCVLTNSDENRKSRKIDALLPSCAQQFDDFKTRSIPKSSGTPGEEHSSSTGVDDKSEQPSSDSRCLSRSHVTSRTAGNVQQEEDLSVCTHTSFSIGMSWMIQTLTNTRSCILLLRPHLLPPGIGGSQVAMVLSIPLPDSAAVPPGSVWAKNREPHSSRFIDGNIFVGERFSVLFLLLL